MLTVDEGLGKERKMTNVKDNTTHTQTRTHARTHAWNATRTKRRKTGKEGENM